MPEGVVDWMLVNGNNTVLDVISANRALKGW